MRIVKKIFVDINALTNSVHRVARGTTAGANAVENFARRIAPGKVAGWNAQV